MCMNLIIRFFDGMQRNVCFLWGILSDLLRSPIKGSQFLSGAVTSLFTSSGDVTPAEWNINDEDEDQQQ